VIESEVLSTMKAKQLMELSEMMSRQQKELRMLEAKENFRVGGSIAIGRREAAVGCQLFEQAIKFFDDIHLNDDGAAFEVRIYEHPDEEAGAPVLHRMKVYVREQI